MATADAIDIANNVLRRKFGLSDDVRMDAAEVSGVARAILSLEVFQILTRQSVMTPRAKREFVRRVVAKFFPIRDGAISGAPKLPAPSPQERQADIESIIARELRNSYGPRNTKK